MSGAIHITSLPHLSLKHSKLFISFWCRTLGPSCSWRGEGEEKIVWKYEICCWYATFAASALNKLLVTFELITEAADAASTLAAAFGCMHAVFLRIHTYIEVCAFVCLPIGLKEAEHVVDLWLGSHLKFFYLYQLNTWKISISKQLWDEHQPQASSPELRVQPPTSFWTYKMKRLNIFNLPYLPIWTPLKPCR